MISSLFLRWSVLFLALGQFASVLFFINLIGFFVYLIIDSFSRRRSGTLRCSLELLEDPVSSDDRILSSCAIAPSNPTSTEKKYAVISFPRLGYGLVLTLNSENKAIEARIEENWRNFTPTQS